MKIAIQGHKTRGKEVIQILESLGGKNRVSLNGDNPYVCYGVYNNTIIVLSNTTNYKIHTLEEFEKEFPFKVGDKVATIWNPDIPYIIEGIADTKYGPRYIISNYDGPVAYAKELIPYKEMKRNITLTLEKAKEWYKKGGELREIALQAFKEKELNSKKWIDLGLPSGTLWCDTNEEGYYSWNEMNDTFDEENLPKLTDFAELYDYCDWRWDSDKKGMWIIGINGNRIFLPASGFRSYCDGSLGNVGSSGHCWSASPGSSNAYSLNFNYNGNVSPSNGNNRANGYSVRLIKRN